MKKTALILFGLVIVGGAGSAFALKDWSHQRTPVEFYTGHTHDEAGTHGAPEHGGGTDAYGCHNASVPYHCH